MEYGNLSTPVSFRMTNLQKGGVNFSELDGVVMYYSSHTAFRVSETERRDSLVKPLPCPTPIFVNV